VTSTIFNFDWECNLECECESIFSSILRLFFFHLFFDIGVFLVFGFKGVI